MIRREKDKSQESVRCMSLFFKIDRFDTKMSNYPDNLLNQVTKQIKLSIRITTDLKLKYNRFAPYLLGEKVSFTKPK
jgi:hypothetical protein